MPLTGFSRTSRSRLRAFLITLGLTLLIATGACSSSESKRERTGTTAMALGSIIASSSTYIESADPNRTHAALQKLPISGLGRDRALVRFDSSELERFAPGDSVTLEFRIDNTDNNWGEEGQQIALYRMTHDWSGSATWNCATDTNPWNTTADCSGADAWDMGTPPSAPQSTPWAAQPTQVMTVTNGQGGYLDFDVTDDLAAFRAGTPNYGWILKKVDETTGGAIDLSSRWMMYPPILFGDCADANDDGFCDAPPSGNDAGAMITSSISVTSDTYIRIRCLKRRPSRNDRDGAVSRAWA